MSRSWKLLVISTLVAVAGAWLLGSPPARPPVALAEDCSEDARGSLVIRIFDTATDAQLSIGGTTVLVKPDPRDFDLDYLLTDTDISDAGALVDQDQDAGIIRFDGACATTGNETYLATVYELPPGMGKCEVVASSDEVKLDEGGEAELELVVDCTEAWIEMGVVPAPTPTATPTLGPDSLALTASTSSLACGGTALLAVEVRDSAGAAKANAPVTVVTSLGSITPASGHVTNANGLVTMTFMAPPSSSGTATIAATSGGLSDTVQIAVTCGTQSGAAQPGGTVVQTTGGDSIITPPSTGSGGLLGAP